MRNAALLLALVASPAAAQDAIPLKWSLKEGDKFFVKDESEAKMSMGFMGQNQEVKFTATIIERFKVIASKQDSTTVELTVQEMKIRGSVPIPELTRLSEKIKGTTISAVLDDNMTVTKILGYDKFIDKLSDNDEKQRKEAKAQFSETAVSEMFSQVFSFSPSKPVKVGDTWPRSEKTSFGGIDSVSKMKFKLDSVSNGIAKLGYTGEVTFKEGATLPGLPDELQVDKMDLKVDKFGGTLKFDTKLGRLTETTQDSDANGTLSLSAGGMKFEMTVKMKIKQKVTIEDKNPIKD
jgi:hypothetical protein